MSEGLFGIHGAALEIRAQRMGMLGSNIANAATPHFKARDIDFQDQIRQAAGSSKNTVQTTSVRHINASLQGATSELVYRDPVSASRDGNTVELNVEQMEFSENVIRYQTSLTFLNNKINGLMTAIRGE